MTLGHQITEEGEETFSDTTHGCSFSVMFIIRFMVKNGSSVCSWSTLLPKCLGKPATLDGMLFIGLYISVMIY